MTITIHYDLLLNATHEAGIDTSEIHWDYDNGDRPYRPMFAFEAREGSRTVARLFSVLGSMAQEAYNCQDPMSIDTNTVMRLAEDITPARSLPFGGYYFPGVTVVGGHPHDC